MGASLNMSDRTCPGCYGGLLFLKCGFYCFECNVSYVACICCDGVAAFVLNGENRFGFICFQCHEFTAEEHYGKYAAITHAG